MTKVGGMWGSVFVIFLVAVSVCLTRSDSERKGVFWVIVRGCIMAGKAWWQELAAAGHISSSARKQREMDAVAQLTLSSLFSLEPWLIR